MRCVSLERYVRLSGWKIDQEILNTIGKFYLVDQIQMEAENKIIEVFFEFLKHLEKMTDTMESMAVKMQELELRITALEGNQYKKDEDDEKRMPTLS